MIYTRHTCVSLYSEPRSHCRGYPASCVLYIIFIQICHTYIYIAFVYTYIDTYIRVYTCMYISNTCIHMNKSICMKCVCIHVFDIYILYVYVYTYIRMSVFRVKIQMHSFLCHAGHVHISMSYTCISYRDIYKYAHTYMYVHI